MQPTGMNDVTIGERRSENGMKDVNVGDTILQEQRGIDLFLCGKLSKKDALCLPGPFTCSP
jgi:hypothetical protein